MDFKFVFTLVTNDRAMEIFKHVGLVYMYWEQRAISLFIVLEVGFFAAK